MVLVIELNTGASVEHYLYRQVHKRNYTDYVAGFYANQIAYKSGRMYKLRGKERTLIHTFGVS